MRQILLDSGYYNSKQERAHANLRTNKCLYQNNWNSIINSDY
ncbi:MAG: hypothetical protein PSX36_01570 [bacterium]|nr:hypothetical protein [bacterium]